MNLLIALDASRSMLAEDVKPSRFALAQKGIDSLLRALGSDRAGMFLFAGDSTLIAPLTFDTVSLQVVARDLTPELAGKGGSNMAALIARAAEYFHRKAERSRVLLILTDGEETEGDAVVAAQTAYQKEGLRIYTIGVGTPSGASIPRWERNLKRDLVRMGTVRDADGKEVRSALDGSVLRSIAQVAGGQYVDLHQARGDLGAVYKTSIAPLAAPMEAVQLEELEEWFFVPLGAALLFLILERWVPWGKSAKTPESGKSRAPAARRLKASSAPARSFVGAALIFVTFLPGSQRAGATELSVTATSIAEAQRLLTAKDYRKAFTLLQTQLLQLPEDPLANYNYALGAYGAGKYSVAIERFERLAQSGEPEVRLRSAGQLGNTYFRSGAEMLAAGNTVGTVTQWQKALVSYRKSGDEAASQNHDTVRSELLALLAKLARARERAGDEEARVSAEKGIPGWQEALNYLDQAVALAGEGEESAKVLAWRQRVVSKIYDAHMVAAEDQRRTAVLQKDAALEMAIEQMESAVAEYEAALAVKPDSKAAANGKREAESTLDPWLVELADQQYREGMQQKRARFFADAIATWKKAGSHYAKVLARSPAHAAAARGQEKNNLALHDAYVALGDEKQQRAARSVAPVAQKDAQFEEALGLYQNALDLQPQNEKTRARLMQLGSRLTGRFVARGQVEYSTGRKVATEPVKPKEQPKIGEAIAWLERSVQSFGKALRFEPKSPPALLGKKQAEELLRELRARDTERERMLAKTNRSRTASSSRTRATGR